MTGPAVDWDWVRKELYRTERITSPAVKAVADECLITAKKLVTPKSASVQKNVIETGPSSIKLAGNFIISSHTLSSHMNGASLISFFLVTIGPDLEKKASELMAEGDPLTGYLLDCTGSIAVESLADAMEKSLVAEYGKKDRSVSMRFSPGYCDWKIEEQSKLANILDFQKAGVKLNEKYMMTPKKSISAACAIGPKGLFSRKKSHCSLCAQDECVYRRD